jgi:hypothetical protein
MGGIPQSRAMWAFSLGLMWFTSAWAGTPRSSSVLRDSDGVQHTAAMAFDGLLSTAWAEGESGDGEGTWLELRLDRTMTIESLSIWPGDMTRGLRSLREVGRPHTVTVTLSGGTAEPVTQQKRLLDAGEHGPLRTDIRLEEPVEARTIRVHVDQVYAGGIKSDLYISEVALNLVSGEVPSGIAQLETWLLSSSGERAREASKAEVDALVEAIQAEEFGDRESLATLIERASDGAPFMQSRARSMVPAGFRMQAVPPDADAVNALVALEDGNAVSALESAALRMSGKESRSLTAKASYFRAKQDLVGARRSLEAYGESGWESGALNGRGEPLDIEVDLLGRVYVADVGNHRVQRFNDSGVTDRVWGRGQPTVTTTWFAKKVPYYATGNEPSRDQGGFLNPVAVTRIPGRVTDQIAVLDAAGRVSFMDLEGDVSRVVDLETSSRIQPGLGGEGYLVWAKKQLVAILGDDVFVLSVGGELLGEFSLQDGVPGAAVALSNGKLGLAYGRRLVQYGLDGFRYGDILEGALGRGFEAWDVTFDEQGKLWAVTDQGIVTKFKKPGKVDYKIKVSSYSLTLPRIAVLDGFVYVTHGDHVMRVDALEVRAKAQLAETEAE